MREEKKEKNGADKMNVSVHTDKTYGHDRNTNHNGLYGTALCMRWQMGKCCDTCFKHFVIIFRNYIMNSAENPLKKSNWFLMFP